MAGPVVASAVLVEGKLDSFSDFFDHLTELGQRDSKKLSAKKRKFILENLGISPFVFQERSDFSPFAVPSCQHFSRYQNIRLTAFSASLSPAQIDEMNILQASLRAMELAWEAARLSFLGRGKVWVDGNVLPSSFKSSEVYRDVEFIPLVKGDSRSLIIGLASTVAKVARDSFMESLGEIDQFGPYQFGRHKGYGTPLHLEMLRTLGPTALHRRTFNLGKKFGPQFKEMSGVING